MMPNCLVRGIRAHWLKTAIAVAALAATAAVWAAETDPLADLKSGAAALDQQRYAAAIATLKPLAARLPKLADYVAWFLASAQFESKDYAPVPKTLEAVWSQKPPSPLAARGVLLAARAYEQSGDTRNALDLLRKNYMTLPQPQGDLAMAAAFAGSADAVSAAVYYQRVYYGFPLSAEAAQAEAESARLQAQLGDSYPPAMPNAMLARALKLLDAGNLARARKELVSLIPQLGGAERDLARVRIGVADYNAKDTAAAQRYLTSLEVSAPEADAERMYYLLLCARRLKNQEEVTGTLDNLGRLYPGSRWRLEALLAVANSYLTENQMEAYEPLYRACYESFPQDSQAAGCQWKVAWGHYLRRQSDAASLLRAHLKMFPASENATGALYFLGRLAEASNEQGAARAYYEEIVREYPNYYYTSLARDRLAKAGNTPPAPTVVEFLRSVPFPTRSRTKDFAPNAMAQARIERARILSSAGLDDWAEGELRFGAQTEDQSHVMAMELASMSSRRTSPDQAINYIKRYASSYLYLPINSAPDGFWKFAFPLPYREELERYSKRNGLDPFLMAALVRQESEFNPKAVSRANARGLAQILPATGRELSRRLKLPYSTAQLFQPIVSLELGTFYLKSIADSLGGNWEAALAGYNAGLARARSWLSWGDFREPAEFIETVPFSETRNYVQTVLRNADVYRRVYGGSQAAAAVPYTPGTRPPH